MYADMIEVPITVEIVYCGGPDRKAPSRLVARDNRHLRWTVVGLTPRRAIETLRAALCPSSGYSHEIPHLPPRYPVLASPPTISTPPLDTYPPRTHSNPHEPA